MTEPVDDSYPWGCGGSRHIRERDQERTEFETMVASLSDEELERIRRDEN